MPNVKKSENRQICLFLQILTVIATGDSIAKQKKKKIAETKKNFKDKV